MNIKEKKSGWMQAIAEGRTEQVLEEISKALQAWSDQFNSTGMRELFRQFTLLSGRWKGLQQESALGIIDAAEKKLEQNQLTHALITFIDELPDELSQTVEQGKRSRRRLGFMGGAALLLIVSAILMIKMFHKSEDPPADHAQETAAIEPDTTAVQISPKPESVVVDLYQLDYAIPKIFPIDWNLVPGICEHPLGCLVEEFLPIGWSADDKYFAYLTQPENEAVGGYGLIFHVQDLETNELVWTYEYGVGETNGYNRKDDIQSVWEKLKEQFTGKLRRYGIIPGTGKREVFPWKHNEKLYDVRLDQTMKENEFGIMVVYTEKVFATVNGQGAGMIFTNTFEKYGPLHTAIVGALVSPTKKRAALIKVNEKRGWEGPPNKLSATVIGFDLRQGF